MAHLSYQCHTSYLGSINRRIKVQAHLSIKRDTISKITKAKRTGSMTQVVELLPRKSKALSSNPHTSKKTTKKF
jgi:hypothetical protein